MNARSPGVEFRMPLPWLTKLSGSGLWPHPSRAVPPTGRPFDGLRFLTELRSVVTLERRRGPTLSEGAFRWLLANERVRASRSDRPLRLLLVSRRFGPRQAARLERAVANKLFAALREVARETDIIGWYREDRVAGVVLTEGANGQEPDACARILQRVGGALDERLPSRVARQLRLRTLRVRPKHRNQERP